MPPRSREVSIEDKAFRAVVGANVRRRRERAGMSLEELAGLTEVSVSTIGRIELGEQVISTDLLARIAGALHTSAASLCRDTTPSATAS